MQDVLFSAFPTRHPKSIAATPRGRGGKGRGDAPHPRNGAHLLFAKLTEVVVIFVKFIFVLVQNKIVVIFVAPHMTA